VIGLVRKARATDHTTGAGPIKLDSGGYSFTSFINPILLEKCRGLDSNVDQQDRPPFEVTPGPLAFGLQSLCKPVKSVSVS